MLGKISDIFISLYHNEQNNDQPTDQSDNPIIDMNKIIGDINDIIVKISCNHDWIDYNDIRLEEIASELNIINNKHLTRITSKLQEGLLDDLDSKMLQLLVVWSPPAPRVYGKCMICNEDVVVLYINNRHIIFA